MSLNKKIFMLKKIISDINVPKVRYNLTEDIHSEKLGEYYFVFQEKRVSVGKDQALIKKFDENGIPINKTYIDVTDKDYVYFPISIGQMGLSIFHTYLNTGSDLDIQRFLKFVDWFYDNGVTDKKLGTRWLTDVSLPQYKNPGPWQSAFSQSRAISVLLRGYQVTGNKKYAVMAKDALQPFSILVKEGGVASDTKWGLFYEEYPSSVPTMVLNGKIFALCGIYDYIRVFRDDQQAHDIFKKGLETLIKVLPEYDLGYWSRYNLCKADWHPDIDPATRQYQRLHVVQLKLLFKMTGVQVFEDYSYKFHKQDTLLNALRMYVLKYKSLKKIGRL
jgi:heparosan-N-sulfate-glucuronate 5-epimerase